MGFTTKGVCLFIIISFLFIPLLSLAQNTVKNILIVYYTRTGKTKLICETLQKNLGATAIEIKDKKDRSGGVGYSRGSLDATLNSHTIIEPEKIDLSPYTHIIIATPIWEWKLSPAMHTFIEAHNFAGKKILLLTTANIRLDKYEGYGDDAPYSKKFFKNWLRGKNKGMEDLAKSRGGEFLGHVHFATQYDDKKLKPPEQIVKDTLSAVDKIKKILSYKSDAVLNKK
jgi:flavodoxin